MYHLGNDHPVMTEDVVEVVVVHMEGEPRR